MNGRSPVHIQPTFLDFFYLTVTFLLCNMLVAYPVVVFINCGMGVFMHVRGGGKIGLCL